MTVRTSLSLSHEPSVRAFVIDGTISKKCFDRALKKLGLTREQVVDPPRGSAGLRTELPAMCFYKGEFIHYREQPNGDIHVRMASPTLSEELGLPWLVMSSKLQ
jgi:hypothetical protein